MYVFFPIGGMNRNGYFITFRRLQRLQRSVSGHFLSLSVLPSSVLPARVSQCNLLPIREVLLSSAGADVSSIK